MHRSLAALFLSAALVLTPTMATAAIVAPTTVTRPAVAAAADSGPSWSVAPAPAADGSVRPNFDYQVDPGGTITDAIAVRNTGTTALTLQVYAADAFTTREGNIDLLPAGEKSRDSGTWVKLSASSVTIDPGVQTVVPFTVTVPADARPGDHPTGIVTTLRSEDAGATVQVDRRLGSRMQIRVSGDLAPAATISDLHIDYSGVWNLLATGDVDVTYELKNTGNTRVTGTASATAHGPFGLGAVTIGDEQLSEVLPGSTIAVHQRLRGVGALFWLGGQVTVSPESVGVGGRALDALTTSFATAAIPAVPLIILLALLAATLTTLVLLRRRRTGAADPKE